MQTAELFSMDAFSINSASQIELIFDKQKEISGSFKNPRTKEDVNDKNLFKMMKIISRY